MRALRLVEPRSPVAPAELPGPVPGPGEVVVQVAAAGICHSDVHYRAGSPLPPSLPLTLGHEIAGTIAEVGAGIPPERIGERVAVHYVVSCTRCRWCARGAEQFCSGYQMLGMTRDGGWADFVVIPARNAVTLPEPVPFEHAAVMMCSSATSLHALRRARLRPGERVAVFGAGGLGMSAVQLARLLGAAAVYAIDVDPGRLALAADHGAEPIGAELAPERLRAAGGVDVALDLTGSDGVLASALSSLSPQGRAVAVGIAPLAVDVSPYRDLIGPEAELIGSNDHLLSEVHELLTFAAAGLLRLDRVITERVPLDAGRVNAAMDRVGRYGGGVRTVILP